VEISVSKARCVTPATQGFNALRRHNRIGAGSSHHHVPALGYTVETTILRCQCEGYPDWES